jgi:hypothetical protein
MDPMPLGVRLLFAAMQTDQRAMDRFMGSIAGTVPLPEFLSPVNAGAILMGGLLRKLRGVRSGPESVAVGTGT